MTDVKAFLDEKADYYNRPFFIESDPIFIPHQFTKKQDIEISGLITAMLAWGQRVTIIRKCTELFQFMDNAPHDFILNHREEDLKRFLDFKHRTFNPTDTLYFIDFFHRYYSENESLEDAFLKGGNDMEKNLSLFHDHFFDHPDAPHRTRKHIPTPSRKSTCKRMNMFLRWMVRKDDKGVDFGIWEKLSPADLICPVDLHVDRVARKLGLIERKQTDWQTAMELTETLRSMDPVDPVRYDFALFGLGVHEKF